MTCSRTNTVIHSSMRLATGSPQGPKQDKLDDVQPGNMSANGRSMSARLSLNDAEFRGDRHDPLVGMRPLLGAALDGFIYPGALIACSDHFAQAPSRPKTQRQNIVPPAHVTSRSECSKWVAWLDIGQ